MTCTPGVALTTGVTESGGISGCPATSDNSVDVGPRCQGRVMNDVLVLRGIELRYVLTMQLFDDGPSTVAELADALARGGFGVRGRASKAISDALRWERRYCRVRRMGRGRYGPGRMPRGTEYRIHKRVLGLRDRVRCRSEPGISPPPDEFDTAGVVEQVEDFEYPWGYWAG